jgi:carbon storage regulator CsrA
MLVLSRRPNEKIVFPSLGITIQVAEIKKGRVRLGIEAPPEVKVLRDELAGGQKTKGEPASEVHGR